MRKCGSRQKAAFSLSKNPDSGTRIGVKNSSETKIEIKAGKNEEQTEVKSDRSHVVL